MPDTATKPLPNGTKLLAVNATVWKGPLPVRSNGKERIPSPYDEVVLRAKNSGESILLDLPPDPDLRKVHIQALHKAAKFHEIGLDIWSSLEEGVLFKTRPKRDVKRGASNGK